MYLLQLWFTYDEEHLRELMFRTTNAQNGGDEQYASDDYHDQHRSTKMNTCKFLHYFQTI